MLKWLNLIVCFFDIVILFLRCNMCKPIILITKIPSMMLKRSGDASVLIHRKTMRKHE